MKFFEKYFSKLNRTSYSLFTGCGRLLGNLQLDDPNTQHYAGNIFHRHGLNSHELAIWGCLNAFSVSSEKMWIKECLSKNYIAIPEEIEYYKKQFIKEHILLQSKVSSIDDPVLKNYSITKNGICSGFSSSRGKWIIRSVYPEMSYDLALSSEEYDLWRSATGVCTMYDTIKNFMNIQKCSAKKALTVFSKCIHRFHKAGYWNVEYFGNNSEVYSSEEQIHITLNQEDWFDKSKLNDYSQIIALGESDRGKRTAELVEITLGNRKKVPLNYQETLVWLYCRKNRATIAKMRDVFTEQDNLWEKVDIYEIVTKLLDQKLIMLWPETWKYGEDHRISAPACGYATSLVEGNKHKMNDVGTGKVSYIPKDIYLTWVFSHGFVPLGTTVEALKKALNISQEEAEKTVSRAIPTLMENGLINLQIIPPKTE